VQDVYPVNTGDANSRWDSQGLKQVLDQISENGFCH